MFKYEDIKPQVLKLLKSNSPISTGFIAKELDLNWITTQRALFELLNDEKVTHQKISGRLLWWFNDKKKD